ncbi:MAG TPA: maleylpyruvate isomerase family mycothiol-dependent enzyme [Dermatophilaceae bacterium]|nr:maleylpyruvate isomerase family mycothiol-dependent enzyme [Dermatophilaceae bacterium]
MTTVFLSPYRAALTPLTDTIASITDWSAASPCEGWSALDVLDHVLTTQRGLLAERGITLTPAPDIPADPAAAWAEHSTMVAGLLDDPAISGIAYDGFFGPTTLGETVDRFYVFDMLVHRWDLARAAGTDTSFTEAELDLIEASAASFGPALYMEGICRSGVEAPAGADRQTQVLAMLGRRG